jgi:hypothetical protein
MIHFDLSSLAGESQRLLEAGFLQGGLDGCLDSPLSLLERSGLDICVTAAGTAPGTGDHVIRLGILGIGELAASAGLALEGDSVGHFSSAPCDAVEITPEMEEAGLQVLMASGRTYPESLSSDGLLVREIFAAMWGRHSPCIESPEPRATTS